MSGAAVDIRIDRPGVVLPFPGAGAVAESGSSAEAVRPTADEEVPDMRGIKETAERFGLPVHFIRAAVATGKVFAVQAGRKKFYVNQASVVAWLNGNNA